MRKACSPTASTPAAVFESKCGKYIKMAGFEGLKSYYFGGFKGHNKTVVKKM